MILYCTKLLSQKILALPPKKSNLIWQCMFLWMWCHVTWHVDTVVVRGTNWCSCRHSTNCTAMGGPAQSDCSANVMTQWWYLVTGDGETWMDSNHRWQWNWQTMYSSDRTKSKPGGTISCWKNQSIEFSCWKGCKNNREQSQYGSCGSSA